MIVEVGTGSGAIAVSIAASMPCARMFASDLSREALSVATTNARTHHITDRTHFVCGDLLAWLGHPVDLILANLPYLTEERANSPELAAEPRIALAGGHGVQVADLRAATAGVGSANRDTALNNLMLQGSSVKVNAQKAPG